MKTIYLILVSVILLIMSCQKSEEANNEISAQDIEAIEGMEKSYLNAVLYNDTIFTCLDSNLFCESEYLNYCDSLFHHNEDEYNHWHSMYSHANAGDDHHHESMGQNHHGNGMMGGQNQGHSLQSMNQMDSLLSNHSTYH